MAFPKSMFNYCSVACLVFCGKAIAHIRDFVILFWLVAFWKNGLRVDATVALHATAM